MKKGNIFLIANFHNPKIGKIHIGGDKYDNQKSLCGRNLCPEYSFISESGINGKKKKFTVEEFLKMKNYCTVCKRQITKKR